MAHTELPFIPLKIAVLTVSDTRSLETDTSGDALVAAASAGLGIVISPTFIVAEALRRGQLVEILADFRRAAVPIHAVYPPGRLPPHRVQVITAFLRERFGDRPYWEDGLDIGAE